MLSFMMLFYALKTCEDKVDINLKTTEGRYLKLEVSDL